MTVPAVVDFSAYTTDGPDYGPLVTPGPGPDFGTFLTPEAQGIPRAPASGVGGSLWDATGIPVDMGPTVDSAPTQSITDILGNLGGGANPVVTAATSVPGGTDLLQALTKPGGLATWWDTFTRQLGAQNAAASKAAASVQTQQVLSNKTGASASAVLIIAAIAVAGLGLFVLSGRS